MPDQNSLLFKSKQGVPARDVWEHSYYLQHQNRRPEYPIARTKS